MKRYYLLGCLLFTSLLALPVTVVAQPSIECTERECLISLVDDYLAALFVHDPSLIPFSEDVYFVENIQHLALGEGLWQTALEIPSGFKIYVPDPVTKEIAFMGMLSVEGKPELVAVRLKVVDGEVAEAEHLVTTSLKERNLKNLQTVRPELLSTIPEGERMSREKLAKIAYSYYDAVDDNDGSLSPVSDDCMRRENGAITSNSGIPDHKASESPNYQAMTCEEQFNSGMYAYIDTINNRRVLAIDPQTGLAFGFSHFHHGMENKIIPIYGVRGVKEREVNYNAFDLPAAHIFKIANGEIHEIEAMGFLAPLDSLTGWESK